MNTSIFFEAFFGVIQLKLKSFFSKQNKNQMSSTLIKNARIVNEGRVLDSDILLKMVISEISKIVVVWQALSLMPKKLSYSWSD